MKWTTPQLVAVIVIAQLIGDAVRLGIIALLGWLS